MYVYFDKFMVFSTLREICRENDNLRPAVGEYIELRIRFINFELFT